MPDLPVWLDTLMLHLLEKDKDKRPLDAATVGRMLGEIEEKVAAQQSAGEAAAKARRIDRPLTDAALTRRDLEAARTLRDSKVRNGSGKRKRRKPRGSRALAQVLPPLAGLLLIAGLILYLAMPEGPEKLYAEVKRCDSRRQDRQSHKVPRAFR